MALKVAAIGVVLATLGPASSAPVRYNREETRISLSGILEDYALADSGRYLVLKEANRPRIAVYDTGTRAVAGHIDVGSKDYVVGAGGSIALVFVAERNELQSWDLTTLARISSRSFDERLVVTDIIMGHSRDDLAIVRLAAASDLEPGEPGSILSASMRFVNPRDCAPIGFGLTTPRNMRDQNTRDYVHFRATGDLQRITQWCTSHSPSGMGLHCVEGSRLARSFYNHSDKGHIAIGETGDIYTGNGEQLRFLDPSPRTNGVLDQYVNICHIANRSLIPSITGVLFVGISKSGQIDLFRSGRSEPLCSIGEFPHWKTRAPQPSFAENRNVTGGSPAAEEDWIKSRITLDRRIILSPSRGFIIFLPHSNQEIVQSRFDVREALDASGNDYLLTLNSPMTQAIAGTQWRHRIEVLAKHSPVEFSLAMSPQGMTVTRDGELTWNLPGGTRGVGDVVVVIKDAAENMIRETFSIHFAPGDPRTPKRF